METDRLRHFLAVAETGSVRKAAELLRLSPGGVSKSIRILEREVDARLLAPSGRGIELTDAGRKLRGRCTPLLAEVARLRGDLVEAPAGAAARLTIGTFEVFSTYFLGLLAARELTDVPLRLLELVPGHLEAALLDRRIDVGITYLPVARPGVAFTRVATIEMGIFGLAGRKGTLPFVVPVAPFDSAPTGVKGLDAWPEHELTREVRYEVELMESALELCRRGLAVAFLPAFVVELHNEMAHPRFRLEKRPSPRGLKTVRRDVFLVTRAGAEETRSIRRIARALRAAASKA